MTIQNFCIIVSGPTGVGKTEFVDTLSQQFPAEIINADMGQLYSPLTIGTAKPDWQSHPITHHLFDVIHKPEVFTVTAFRDRVINACNQVWRTNKIPIIVGGSGYYLTALFFPPAQHEKDIIPQQYAADRDLWEELNAIDAQRAKEIDPTDRYRLERALNIWHSTGVQPSQYKPQYEPIADYFFIWLERDRDDLYRRINERTEVMIDQGWIDEVEHLDSQWRQFLKEKKIIGYPEVIAYCDGMIDKDAMIRAIQKKTRNYAKRQMTFWRMLKKKLAEQSELSSASKNIMEYNLTNQSIDRYSKQLITQINAAIKEAV